VPLLRHLAAMSSMRARIASRWVHTCVSASTHIHTTHTCVTLTCNDSYLRNSHTHHTHAHTHTSARARTHSACMSCVGNGTSTSLLCLHTASHSAVQPVRAHTTCHTHTHKHTATHTFHIDVIVVDDEHAQVRLRTHAITRTHTLHAPWAARQRAPAHRDRQETGVHVCE
jgi:hypothetical protein